MTTEVPVRTELPRDVAAVAEQPRFALRAWFGGSRTGRAVGGLVVDYFGTASSAVLSFIVTPTLVAYLGLPMYGYWVAASQILLWLSLLDGGIGVNLIKTISAHKDTAPERVERAIASTFWCYMTLAAMTVLAGGAMLPFVARWTHVQGAAAREATITFALGVATSAIALVVVPTFYVILQGYQKLALVNAIVTGAAILATLSGFILVILGMGVVGLAIGQLISTTFSALLAITYSKRICRYRLSPRLTDRAEVREMAHFAGYFTLSKIAFLTSNYSDAILIAMFYGTAPVSVFSLTQKLSAAAFMFVAKVGPAAIPGLAELVAKDDVEAVQKVMLRMTRVLFRIAIIVAALIIALNHRFVSIWTGDATYGGLLLTILFAWGIFRDTIIRNSSAVLFAAGQIKGWGIFSAAEALLKVAISVALLPRLGIIAPMIGTAVAELITCIYTPIKLSSLTKLRLRTALERAILPSIARSIPSVAVLIALSMLIPHSWRWLGLAIIGASTLLVNVVSFDFRTVKTAFAAR